MFRSDAWRAPAVAVAFVLVAATACASASVAGRPSAVDGAGPVATPAATGGSLPSGPVTVIALGDSLTAGVGDEAGQGYAGRLAQAVEARRPGSTLNNLGQSGWTSTEMVNGQQDVRPELEQAVAAARAAAPAAVLATVLIGSNDLWHVYQDATVSPAPSADEEAAAAAYRANLDRTVTELRAAGAVVVVGLPDDQSVRPGYADVTRLNQQLPDITAEEVAKMSALAKLLARTAGEVAAAHGVRTVDTSDPFWADPARMDADGIHPNAAGYTEMARPWVQTIEPLL